MSVVTVPPWRSRFYLAQENTEQVNCLVSKHAPGMSAIPQLLTYRRGAANRRFGPLGDVVGEVIHRHASPQREVWRATNLVVSLLGLPSANHRGNVHDPKEFYIYPPLTTRVPDDRAEASRHVPSIRARVH